MAGDPARDRHRLTTAGILLFCSLGTAARAQTVCQTPAPLGGRIFPGRIAADGLAVSSHEGNTALWPSNPHMKLNLEYAVELAFSDHSGYSVRLPAGTERGAVIVCERKSVVAIDAAVCDDSEGFCVPVHIDIPR